MMLVVKYEIYWNDYYRKHEHIVKTDWADLADWIFRQMKRDYTNDHYAMSFPTPATVERIHADGPWAIQFKPDYGEPTYWIHEIDDGRGGIIFSDGQYTSGQKHWGMEVKNWLTKCEERRTKPKFNFVV